MDVKRLYRDIGYVSDVSPTAIVEGAIREQDASGTLTARLANQFGLKAMFLMMVNAPLVYRAGVHGEDYIDLSTQVDTDS